MAENSEIPPEHIEQSIVFIKGHKVMLDEDLAELYGVETRILVRNVKRNIERFPAHFMFQLTSEEYDRLRSQIGISKSKRGGRRYLPYAFTEQGVAMLSSVLHSKRAIQVNIAIMDTFVRLRQMLSSHAELARKLDTLEKKYDTQFKAVFDAIRALMTPPVPKRRNIGFHTEGKKER
jgi:phage regulator Rha-like protein